MQSLKVHDKLSKAQRLMKGRRFRVLKEIDEEIDHEVNACVCSGIKWIHILYVF